MAGLEAVSQMAQQWGRELVNVDAVGSLNPASGFGEWPLAQSFIAQLERCAPSALALVFGPVVARALSGPLLERPVKGAGLLETGLFGNLADTQVRVA